MTTEGKVSPLPLVWADSRYLGSGKGWQLVEPANADEPEVLAVGPLGRVVTAPMADHVVLYPVGNETDGIGGSAEYLAFIVRAVNAHDRLVGAIERFIAAADDSCDASHGHDDVAAMLEYNAAFTELGAALAAAKEG